MMSIHDAAGGRKYLTGAEHTRFLVAADQAPRDVRAFCHTLAWTGCRLSEALALTGERIDVVAGTVTFESLKKRQRGLFRTVPIPPELATMLDLVFAIRSLRGPASRGPLWPWSRATAWRRVKEVLAAAGIEGAHASPKGLRHALGVAAVGQGIPLNMVQRWLGHAQLTTTAIYARVALATAHLDHDPAHNQACNLRCLCQRCHLLHDRAHHLAQRFITFRLRMAIGDMFTGRYRQE